MKFLLLLLVFLANSQLLASTPCVEVLNNSKPTVKKSIDHETNGATPNFLTIEENIFYKISDDRVERIDQSEQSLLNYMGYLTEQAEQLIDEHQKALESIDENQNGAANLNGANLNGAKLNGANLNGANLNGAKLNGANTFNGTNTDSGNEWLTKSKSFLEQSEELSKKLLSTHYLVIDRLLDFHLEKQEDNDDTMKRLKHDLNKEFLPAMQDFFNYSRRVKRKVEKRDVEAKQGYLTRFDVFS